MRKTILIIIITAIITGVITTYGAYAATTYAISANKVAYSDNSNLGVTEVQAAVDGVCNKMNNKFTSLENMIIEKIYPVGSIYISEADSTVQAVKERFGGEWESYGSGKTLIGAGTGIDANGTTQTFSVTNNSKNLGEYKHKLTVSELPSHTHPIPSLSVSSWSGSHAHDTLLGYAYFDLPNTGTNNMFVARYSYNGSKTYFTAANDINTQAATITVSGQKTTASTSNAAGGGTHFNVINPYITVYMYKRVS